MKFFENEWCASRSNAKFALTKKVSASCSTLNRLRVACPLVWNSSHPQILYPRSSAPSVVNKLRQKTIMHAIFLHSHNPHWAEEFARESAAVAGGLGNILIAIHHIGSTAIPGIRAKPVIDMLAVATDVTLLDKTVTRMEALGYEALGEFGIAGRRYFRKGNHGGQRTHQLHAFQVGSPQIARHLAFRDFLRVHPDYAKEYEALKQRLAESYPNDLASYTDGKDSFIQDIDARAAFWFAARANESFVRNLVAQ